MADFCDIGSESAEQLLADALARQLSAGALPAVSATWCEDCGEAIPQLRREKVPGCQTCYDCQSLREVRRV